MSTTGTKGLMTPRHPVVKKSIPTSAKGKGNFPPAKSSRVALVKSVRGAVK